MALLWVGFIAVVLVLPPNQLTGKTLAVVLAALGLLWAARDRHHFTGPRFSHHEEA